MAGQPRKRARIAAQIAAQGGVPLAPPPRHGPKPKARVAPSIPTGVVTSLPPKPVVDPTDASFGAALASAASLGETNKVFEELREEALKFALEVMRMKLDPDERSFAKLLGVKQQITTAVLTATVRTRPGDLRDRDDDGVGALLRALKAGDSEPTAADLLA